jgi:hypothetical protein
VLRFITISISPKSPDEFTLPSQKANKSVFEDLMIAGIRKLLYPSVPEIKTDTFLFWEIHKLIRENIANSNSVIFFILLVF